MKNRSIFAKALLTIACLSLLTAKAKRIKEFEHVYTEQRIVGGTIAEEGLAPYQVSLLREEEHTCAGAIIDSEWIITAAHCVASFEAPNITILTGTQDLTKPGVLYHIKRIYSHCNFNNPHMHNDIALLHLNSSIILNDKTQVVELPKKPLKDGDKVLLTGWGAEEAYAATEEQLKKIELVFLEHTRCKKNLKYDPDLDVGHICTFTKHGEGSCHGDSGGPLLNNGTLVGIVNWGYPCAIGYPDVYANVYFYLNWIRIVMSGNANCLR